MTAERDRLVEQHWHLVKETVDRFLRRHPSSGYLRDDMLAATALRLVELATEFGNSGVSFDRIALYNLRWACLGVIQQDEAVSCPPRPAYHLARRRKRTDATAQLFSKADSGLDDVELADWIDRHCRDYIDWATVTLSREGYSIPQIAKQLRVHYTTVQRRLERFRELLSKWST